MPDHRLKPLTALGHATPHTVSIGPVTITEVTSFALASLATRRGRAADVAKAARAANIALPAPGHATADALWLAPDQWLLQAPFATNEDITAHLKLLFGDAASFTEQTDAWVRFDLTGPNLHAMFERLCNLDTRAMQPGTATRSVIEHLGCYVICHAERFTLLGPRSSAKSLHHALISATKSAY